MFLYGFVAIGLWINAPAQAEVFRCEDPEQGITYQQTPCPEPAKKGEEQAESTEDEAAESPDEAPRGRAVVGRDQSVADVVAAEQEEQARNAEVEACKQQYRDAIDAIDLEIQNSYTNEQRDYYLSRLKALTDKMAAC